MNKKYIDEFYKRVENNKTYDVFSLSLPLLLINKHLHNTSEQYFRSKYNLLHSDIDVLAALYFNNEDKSLSPTELYDATIFSSGGMTKVLKKLEEKGFIKRESSQNDKRKISVKLTQVGADLIEECICSTALRLEDSFGVLNKDEKKNLKDILSKLIYSMI